MKPTVPPAPRPAGQRLGAGEVGHRHPVRDLHRVAAEVLHLHLRGPPLTPRSGRVIFSRHGCSMLCAADSDRDRGFEVWKVATIGPRAGSTASSDRLGATGSCTCSTSNVAVAQPAPHPGRRHRAEAAAGRPSRCSGTGTARPAGDHVRRQRGVVVGRRQHATPRGPAPISASARSRTWAWTPPGTSQEYGQTMPIAHGSRPRSAGGPGRGRPATAAAACASPAGARRSRRRTRRPAPG